MNNEVNKIQEELKQFQGSGVFYPLPLLDTRYTEGIKYLMEKTDCFWLVIDVSAICKSLLNPGRFAGITLNVWEPGQQEEKGYHATLTYDDRNGNVFYTANYTYTDFPLDKIRLYFIHDTLLLPGEY